MTGMKIYSIRVRWLACHRGWNLRGRRMELTSQTDSRGRENSEEKGAEEKENEPEVVVLLSSTPTESHRLSFYPSPVVLSRSTLESNVYLR